jgi:hypothetical protein
VNGSASKRMPARAGSRTSGSELKWNFSPSWVATAVNGRSSVSGITPAHSASAGPRSTSCEVPTMLSPVHPITLRAPVCRATLGPSASIASP